MKCPIGTSRGIVNSHRDVVTFDNENDWEALGESPRYTLDDLLRQCEPAAPEVDDIIAWQNLKKVGREE